MKELEWLDIGEAGEEICKALKIPLERAIEVRHANFGKLKVQKFFVSFDSQEVKANFFADSKIAEREALILDYLATLENGAFDEFFAPPRKLYYKKGLVIREKTPGEILKPHECSDETLVRLAQILLLFKKAPVSEKLKGHALGFSGMKRWAARQLSEAEAAFTPFRGSEKAFADFSKVLSQDWRGRFGRLSKGFVHGDFQPANILLQGDKISLIDFDRGGYFYPLFDVASYAIQFTHAALLEAYHRKEKPNRREIRRRVGLFVKEYRGGVEDFNEEIFRLFKLLIIFNGLAFSTAGFRKKVTRGAKHLLFGLFRQELRWFFRGGSSNSRS